jgi:hypothetical protein
VINDCVGEAARPNLCPRRVRYPGRPATMCQRRAVFSIGSSSQRGCGRDRAGQGRLRASRCAQKNGWVNVAFSHGFQRYWNSKKSNAVVRAAYCDGYTVADAVCRRCGYQRDGTESKCKLITVALIAVGVLALGSRALRIYNKRVAPSGDRSPRSSRPEDTLPLSRAVSDRIVGSARSSPATMCSGLIQNRPEPL